VCVLQVLSSRFPFLHPLCPLRVFFESEPVFASSGALFFPPPPSHWTLSPRPNGRFSLHFELKSDFLSPPFKDHHPFFPSPPPGHKGQILIFHILPLATNLNSYKMRGMIFMPPPIVPLISFSDGMMLFFATITFF